MKPRKLFFYLVFLSACSGESTPRSELPVYRESVEMPIRTEDAQVISLQQIELGQLNQSIIIPKSSAYLDIFKQQEVIPPKIDILIVIDNSLSMEEEQLNLSDKLSYLIADLNDVDWQINIITTDNYCKRIPELPLLPDTEDMARHFATGVRAGINGSGYEIPLKMAYDNLNGRCSGEEKWTREGADLAILVVTDEDEDSSSTYYEDSDRFVLDMKLMNYFAGENFKVYGIVGHPSNPCPTAAALAVTLSEVIDKTDGLWGSICDANYGRTLEAVSRDIRMNLKTDFPLRFKPVISTVRLSLDGSEYAGDWTVVGQRIIISASLPEGSTLTVEYQVESFRLLQLLADPEEYRLSEIRINGTPLDKTKYKYDVVSNSVLLTFDPAAGDKIETVLVQNKQLQTVYPFPLDQVAFIRCFVENEIINSELKIENQTITITPPIPSGMQAHCLYQEE